VVSSCEVSCYAMYPSTTCCMQFKENPTDEKKNKLKKAAKKDPNVVSIKFKGKEVEARRREGSGSDAIYIGKRKG
jgi:hypothetical protein